MAISDAVGLERISRIVGYKLIKGNFADNTPNLPQRIAVLAEANTANQATLDVDTPVQITSAQHAAQLFGWGSPMYNIARILFPVSGGGLIGGIPVIAYPQEEQGGASALVKTVTVSGTATGAGTHYVVIGGRYTLDGDTYAVNIASGDTATQVAVKIADVVNNVLGCPMTASQTSPVGAITSLTTKWKGVTAGYVTVSVDTGSDDLGLTYTIGTTTSAAGTPSVTDSLNLFGNEWNTIVVNSYPLSSTVTAELEAFNGIPDPDAPTGRYSGIIFKPFVALTGTVEDSTTTSPDVLLTDADKLNVTISMCPAPLSAAMPMEAAANMCCLYARKSQDTPHLDVEGSYYPDMPVPETAVPATASYDVRDAIVKKGMSTVLIVAGKYQVQDFVTTYHPVGEVPPQFRYARDLMLDCNVRYGYWLLEQTYVVDHMIANDTDTVNVSKVIKPKQWKAIIQQYAVTLTSNGLVADTAFMQSSITVGISTTNPNRLETFFRYKRTGTVRIASTTAQAGFNFGTV